MHSEDVHALESVETESNLDHADKVINLDLKASEKHVLTTNNSSEETYDLVVIDQIYNETSTTSNLSVNLKCINT